MKFKKQLRLLGYYHFPNQDMKPEVSRLSEAIELAPLIEASLQNLLVNPETDLVMREMLSSATVFIFKDEDNNLYGYFTKNRSVRLTDVKYSKSAIEPVTFKYRAWFVPGEHIKLIKQKNGANKNVSSQEATNKNDMDFNEVVKVKRRLRLDNNMFIGQFAPQKNEGWYTITD